MCQSAKCVKIVRKLYAKQNIEKQIYFHLDFHYNFRFEYPWEIDLRCNKNHLLESFPSIPRNALPLLASFYVHAIPFSQPLLK